MRIICVDDEALVLQLTASLCRKLPQVDEVEAFDSAQAVLDWIKENDADIALLEIDMPNMDGITLAARIKEEKPDTAVIFLTGYSQYALDAFSVHASGYLLKPISQERLSEEIDYALSRVPTKPQAHISVRTFGNFEILVDGETVTFSRSKARELLAYLVDRQGRGVSRADIFAALWEEGVYDRSMQKQLDVIIRSLRSTLEDHGIGEILEVKGGMIRICPETFDCDLYRFLGGDVETVNSYRGEYMSSYPWASMTEAYVTRLQNKDRD